VLVPVEHLGPNDGVAVSTFQVTRELARRGHEIDVAHLWGGPFEAEYRLFARTVIRVDRFHFPRNRPWRAVYPMGPGVVQGARLRPDVIYDNLLWTLPWSVGVSALTGAPVVGHMRGYHPGGPSNQQRLLMTRRVRSFLAVSEFSRGQLLALGVDPARIEVVHNGVDPAAYPVGDLTDRARARTALGLRAESFVLLFLGRIDPNKGVETLLDAVRQSRHVADIELVIAGRPVSADYLASMQDRGRGLQCHWWPETADVLPLLHATDVLVAPSLWDEPFGRTIIEAFATGRPAVASRAGGLPEIFPQEMDRLLFERGSVGQLTACVDSLRDWQSREPDLGLLCADLVRRKFSLTATVDAVEARLLVSAASRRRLRRSR
jgi:glycosyltransferase involved in cell wall biosynthesis